MATPFQHTIRSIERRRGRPWLVAAGAVAVLASWSWWFLAASLPVHETSVGGRVESDAESGRIQAPVAGLVVAHALEVGKRVAAGDTLIELDASSLRDELVERQTRLQAFEAQLATLARTAASHSEVVSQIERDGRFAAREAESSLAGARSDVDLARREAERTAALADEGLVSGAELDNAQSRSASLDAAAGALRARADRVREATRLQVRERTVQLGELERDRDETAGAIAVERASIERIQHEIGRRTVRAPVAGVIGAIGAARVGAYLQEGAEVAVVVPDGRLRVVASFPASSAGRLRPGQAVVLRFPAYPWTAYGSRRGRVARVANEAVDQRLRVEIDLIEDPTSSIPMQHGLEVVAEVTTESISPARLLLRHAGAWIDGAGGDGR